jgi:hypothetical protein
MIFKLGRNTGVPSSAKVDKGIEIKIRKSVRSVLKNKNA